MIKPNVAMLILAGFNLYRVDGQLRFCITRATVEGEPQRALVWFPVLRSPAWIHSVNGRGFYVQLEWGNLPDEGAYRLTDGDVAYLMESEHES